jgi:hypothetical protein
MYTVNNQQNIGVPDIIREVKVLFTIDINGIEIPLSVPLFINTMTM